MERGFLTPHGASVLPPPFSGPHFSHLVNGDTSPPRPLLGGVQLGEGGCCRDWAL